MEKKFQRPTHCLEIHYLIARLAKFKQRESCEVHYLGHKQFNKVSLTKYVELITHSRIDAPRILLWCLIRLQQASVDHVNLERGLRTDGCSVMVLILSWDR